MVSRSSLRGGSLASDLQCFEYAEYKCKPPNTTETSMYQCRMHRPRAPVQERSVQVHGATHAYSTPRCISSCYRPAAAPFTERMSLDEHRVTLPTRCAGSDNGETTVLCNKAVRRCCKQAGASRPKRMSDRQGAAP